MGASFALKILARDVGGLDDSFFAAMTIVPGTRSEPVLCQNNCDECFAIFKSAEETGEAITLLAIATISRDGPLLVIQSHPSASRMSERSG